VIILETGKYMSFLNSSYSFSTLLSTSSLAVDVKSLLEIDNCGRFFAIQFISIILYSFKRNYANSAFHDLTVLFLPLPPYAISAFL